MPSRREHFTGSPRVTVDQGRRALAFSPGDVFLVYFAMGGTEDQEAIYRFLNGDGDLSHAQFDVLAAALNDEFVGRGGNHPVPYAADFLPSATRHAPPDTSAPPDAMGSDGLRPRSTGRGGGRQPSGGAGTPAFG